jgi:hypothetical protein
VNCFAVVVIFRKVCIFILFFEFEGEKLELHYLVVFGDKVGLDSWALRGFLEFGYENCFLGSCVAHRPLKNSKIALILERGSKVQSHPFILFHYI